MKRRMALLIGLGLIGCSRPASRAPGGAADAGRAGAGSTTGGSAGSTSSTGSATGSSSTGSTGGTGGEPCGTCPPGYTCGTANGTPVCRAPSGVPLFSHVFAIAMENTSRSTLEQATNTPYLHGLAQSWASAADYHGVAHPSLPNYIALTSGDTQGIACDCAPDRITPCASFDCNGLVGSCGCEQSAASLADDLDAAGLSWRAYGEDMGTPCNTTSSGNYAVKHVPFLYYDDVQGDAARCADHVVDFASAFDVDLASPRSFSFIAPNLVDDMHNPIPASSTNLANGDAWLGQVVPRILASPAFQQGGLLVIVWDEDDDSGAIAPNDPIPLFVLSPLARHDGYSSSARADHYGLLATIEDGLGLPRRGNAAPAAPLADFFPAQ